MNSNKNDSGYSILYSFDYKDHSGSYDYEIPFDVFCDAIRGWFDRKNINLDGTDGAIWNAVNDLCEGDGTALDTIYDDMKDGLTESCKTAAYEEYKDYVDEMSEE